jgi:hypothetical protein
MKMMTEMTISFALNIAIAVAAVTLALLRKA